MAKDTLIKGTIILALAAFIARFLGLVQRVPLKHLLEDSGMATYGIAYNIYFLLLIVATAGIPSALSKLISEKSAIGQYAEADRIFHAAVVFALAAGAVITVLLYVLAPYYAVYISHDSDASLAIRALAPAMLLFPLIAIMRGYFLGKQMMKAGGLSQIAEQIARVLTAVGLAYALLAFGFGHRWAVAGASFGGVAGSVAAFLVMFYYWKKLKASERLERLDAGDMRANVFAAPQTADLQSTTLLSKSQRQAQRKSQSQTQSQTQSLTVVADTISPLSWREIYKAIFRLSIPISLISLAVPTIYFIDSSTVIGLLQNQLGYAEAKETLGLLAGRAQSLAGIPPILAIALSLSILPVISAAHAKNDRLEVERKASQALRLALISGLPVVAALCVAARPLNGFIFGDEHGTWIIAVLTASSLFQIMMMTTSSILMGLGQTKAPMLNVFAGIAVKLAGSFLLAPSLGIYGILLATMLCFMLTMSLNLRALKKQVDYSILGGKRIALGWIALLAIISGIAVDRLSVFAIRFQTEWLVYGVRSLLIGVVILAVYMLLMMRLSVFAQEDLDSLPSRVRRLMKRFG